jgi:hypothetical protein
LLVSSFIPMAIFAPGGASVFRYISNSTSVPLHLTIWAFNVLLILTVLSVRTSRDSGVLVARENTAPEAASMLDALLQSVAPTPENLLSRTTTIDTTSDSGTGATTTFTRRHDLGSVGAVIRGGVATVRTTTTSTSDPMPRTTSHVELYVRIPIPSANGIRATLVGSNVHIVGWVVLSAIVAKLVSKKPKPMK